MFASQNMQDKASRLRCHPTEAEKFVWRKLRRRQLGYKFARQFIIDNQYIVDFICMEKRLIIEIDGGQHCDFDLFVRKNMNLTALGYYVLRLWNNDVLNNWEGCYIRIMEYLQR